MLIKSYAINPNMQFMGKKSKKHEGNDEKPSSNKVLPNVLLGGSFLLINSKTQFINKGARSLTGKITKKKINELFNNKIFTEKENKQIRSLSQKMLAEKKLDNIVKIVLMDPKEDITKTTNKAVEKALENFQNIPLLKESLKDNSTKQRTIKATAELLKPTFKTVQKGRNALFHPMSNSVYISKEPKTAWADLHEIGHSINKNTSKFWSVTQIAGPILPIIAPPLVILTALVTDKPEKTDNNKKKKTKLSTKIAKFIKKNVGLVTFSLFLPQILEETTASLRAYKFAKQNLGQETAKKLAKGYNTALSTYVFNALFTALIAVGLSKAKDIVVDLINKDKSKKATKKED